MGKLADANIAWYSNLEWGLVQKLFSCQHANSSRATFLWQMFCMGTGFPYHNNSFKFINLRKQKEIFWWKASWRSNLPTVFKRFPFALPNFPPWFFLRTMQAAHIRAAYTTENKPWITQSAAYVSHELGHLYDHSWYKTIFVQFIQAVCGLHKPRIV